MIKRNTFAYISGGIILCTATLISFQNCSGTKFAAQSGPAATAAPPTATAPILAEDNCQFIGPSILQARLKNILLIQAGDVPVLDSTGNPTSSMRIASNLSVLGQGDPSQGVPDDYSCSTSKFKTATQVMIDACAISMKTSQASSAVFPNGSGDYSALYQQFLGRAPTSDEISIINRATAGMSGSQAEAAACAIVSSSLEALIAI